MTGSLKLDYGYSLQFGTLHSGSNLFIIQRRTVATEAKLFLLWFPNSGPRVSEHAHNKPCNYGRAIVQAVSRWLPTAAVRGSSPDLVIWDFVVDKVALGQVFSEYFGFPCHTNLSASYETLLVTDKSNPLQCLHDVNPVVKPLQILLFSDSLACPITSIYPPPTKCLRIHITSTQILTL
jgi:hypothetical protein